MKQVDHFDLRILLVEFLILRPPFPRHRIDQLRRFLLQGARVVENPLRFLFVGRRRKIYADPSIERRLHLKNFLEFVHGLKLPTTSRRWQVTSGKWQSRSIRPCETPVRHRPTKCLETKRVRGLRLCSCSLSRFPW